MSLTTPRAALFDLGSTLLRQVRFDLRAGVDVLLNEQTTDQDRADIYHEARALHRELRELHYARTLEIQFQSLLRMLCDQFSLHLQKSWAELELDFWKACSRMAPERGIRSVLDSLREQNVPMGVISNSMFTGPVLSWELERNGLLEYFHFVISSADYGLQKPHRRIFLCALGRLGMEAENVWFLGDNWENDVEGSHQVGMVPIWYNSRGMPCPGSLECTVIAHWHELLPIWSAPHT